MLYLICNVGENMNEKRNKIMLVVLLVALIIVIILLSYAAFRFLGEGQRENVITSGTLKLNLVEGNTINLVDTYPLTDSEGLALDGYDFTLQNTGTASVDYIIYLDDVEIESPDVKLDNMYLKYSLDKNDSVGTAEYLETLGENGSRILDQGTLTSSEENSYVLRVWPTIEIDGDFGGQVWKGKLRITGEQTR